MEQSSAELHKEIKQLMDTAQREKMRAEKAEAERADLANRVMALNLEKMELHARLNAAMKVVEAARKLRNAVHRKGDKWRPKADPVPLRYLAELEDFDNMLAVYDATATKAG